MVVRVGISQIELKAGSGLMIRHLSVAVCISQIELKETRLASYRERGVESISQIELKGNIMATSPPAPSRRHISDRIERRPTQTTPRSAGTRSCISQIELKVITPDTNNC